MLHEESLSQKFLKKGFWLYIFTFLAAPLSYIIKILLSRDLSVADVGVFYGIISLITLLTALNDMGWTESLNYFLPKYIIEKKYGKVKFLLKFVAIIQIIISLFIIGILWFFAEHLAEHYFKNSEVVRLIQIMALFFLGNNLIHIFTALFSATQNTKLQKSTEFVRLLATTFFTTAIFFLDIWTLEIYAISYIIGIVVAIIFSAFFFYKNYYRPYLQNIPAETDKKLIKNFLKYAFPTFLTANISLILSQIDSQLIITLAENGNEAHGYYSNYLSIMTLPFIIISPIIMFLFPVFTELHARGQNEKIFLLYKNMTLYLTILSIWVSFFLFQTGEYLAEILFTEKFLISGEILKYSVPFLIFNILNQLNFQLLAGTGQAWARTMSFGVVLPINILLNIWLIKTLGVHGSALAVGVSWIPLYCFTLFFVRKYVTLPPLFPIFSNISAAIFSYSTFAVCEKFFSLSPLFSLVLSTLIYAVLFFGINFKRFLEAKKIIFSHRS